MSEHCFACKSTAGSLFCRQKHCHSTVLPNEILLERRLSIALSVKALSDRCFVCQSIAGAPSEHCPEHCPVHCFTCQSTADSHASQPHRPLIEFPHAVELALTESCLPRDKMRCDFDGRGFDCLVWSSVWIRCSGIVDCVNLIFWCERLCEFNVLVWSFVRI